MNINYRDLEITTLSHGTCVQVKHTPTNITAECYNFLDERKNRAQALQELKLKIQLSEQRKSFYKQMAKGEI